jgi:cysteine desulfurase/selenocysteine lyase
MPFHSWPRASSASWKELPWKFEAGTPNLEGAVGLGAAIDYIQTISLQKISEHLSTLSSYTQKKLAEIPQVSLIGNPDPKSGIISFVVSGLHPHDLAELLGGKEICIRAGHQCAQPLHQALQIEASNRLSLAVYNNRKDIDRFISALEETITDFSHV